MRVEHVFDGQPLLADGIAERRGELEHTVTRDAAQDGAQQGRGNQFPVYLEENVPVSYTHLAAECRCGSLDGGG